MGECIMKKYQMKKVLEKKGTTWNESDMEDCIVKHAQWEEKQQRKGTPWKE